MDKKRNQMIVGITGCIGSGKSTVCKIFAELGVSVFDSDKAGHAAYLDPEVKSQVLSTFGAEMFVDGEVSRKALATLVFKDKTELDKLTNIVRPDIQKQWEAFKAENIHMPYVLIESALLLQNGLGLECDMIIVVSADESVRIERAVKRDNSTEDDIRARMAHQMSQDDMLELADMEIENNGIDLLHSQVMISHNLILEYAL